MVRIKLKKNYIILKLKSLLCFSISIPVAIIFILAYPFIKIRVGIFDSSRIAHFLENSSKYLLFKEKKFFDIWIVIHPICNLFVLKSFKKKMNIFEGSLAKIFYFTISITNFFFGKKNPFYIKIDNVIHFKYWKNINKKLKLITFSKSREFDLKNILKTKIDLSKKIALFQVRDSGYLNYSFPKKNFSYHTYRNANINNYKKAVLHLIKKKYFVVRVGRNNINTLNISNKNYFDYSSSKLVSDELDFYLAKISSLIICNNVGWESIPTFFNKKIIMADGVLMAYQSLANNYNISFKKMIDNRTNRTIFLKEAIEKKYISIDKSNEFKKNNIKLVNNSPNEILDLVKEAIDKNYRSKIKTKKILKIEKKLKKELSRYLKKNKKLRNPLFFSIPWKFGSNYLKKNY